MLPTVCAPLTTVAPSKTNFPHLRLAPRAGAFSMRSHSTVMPLLKYQNLDGSLSSVAVIAASTLESWMNLRRLRSTV